MPSASSLSQGSRIYGFGVLGVGAGCGGLRLASSMKVDATSNWPSRSRCMAMARLMREGCDDRASFSAEGRGLSLNFWEYLVSKSVRVDAWCRTHSVQSFAILVES